MENLRVEFDQNFTNCIKIIAEQQNVSETNFINTALSLYIIKFMGGLKVEFDQELSDIITDLAEAQDISHTEIIRKALSVYSTILNTIKNEDDYICIKSNKHKIIKSFTLP